MISKSEAIAAREKAEADAQGDGGNRSSSPSSSSSSSSSNGNGRAVTDKTVAAKAVEKETVAESTTANEQEEGIAKLLVGCQGAGVDVEDIGGFPADNETFNERSFTPAEIAYCRAQASFCGRFAAKETVFKAMGVPSKGAAAPMREAGTHPRPRSGDVRPGPNRLPHRARRIDRAAKGLRWSDFLRSPKLETIWRTTSTFCRHLLPGRPPGPVAMNFSLHTSSAGASPVPRSTPRACNDFTFSVHSQRFN
ncbi:unnamed protein product [Tilletia caries]|uniref:4'-phosphopantetheinyl transferase domain-containing protein n=2 Tax=Tilletia TaxID=13289 RepID=A0A8X7MTX9_9BASI|nr:hypothetical protein CF336_g6359 [Tilletia laevis]KAE8247765.1 hypothetical protein A4X06_0g4205 [Tilletia controversa]KAE8256552.1 hypothetical protein A4X03_0g5294 [Tilletia caries]CAD6936233.1 unnamed protein product [Tilletia caries]CAD6962997.1 unnamed protein product [Tilletia caries]